MSRANEYVGPIYGVLLLKELPLGSGLMKQAMPTRKDLLSAKIRSERVSAGYEVLTAHYLASLDEISRLKQVIRNIANGGDWSPTQLQEAIGDL